MIHATEAIRLQLQRRLVGIFAFGHSGGFVDATIAGVVPPALFCHDKLLRWLIAIDLGPRQALKLL